MKPIHEIRNGGFSLLELLCVIAFIGILAALLVPSIGQLSASNRLTQDGNRIVDEFSNARALALARNVPVEVWFLELPGALDGEIRWRALRSRLLEADGSTHWVSRTLSLSERVVLTPSETFSNCIGGQTAEALPDFPASPRGTGVRFYPNGRVEPINPRSSLSLHSPLHVTITSENDLRLADAQLPPNFMTIQIDPRNGRIRSFRP